MKTILAGTIFVFILIYPVFSFSETCSSTKKIQFLEIELKSHFSIVASKLKKNGYVYIDTKEDKRFYFGEIFDKKAKIITFSKDDKVHMIAISIDDLFESQKIFNFIKEGLLEKYGDLNEIDSSEVSHCDNFNNRVVLNYTGSGVIIYYDIDNYYENNIKERNDRYKSERKVF